MLVALAAAYAARFTAPPFAVLFAGTFVATLVLWWRFRGAVLFNAAFVFLALAMAEAYVDYRNWPSVNRPYPQTVADGDLGWSGAPGRYRAVRTALLHTIYDTTYTLGPNRLRVVPSSGAGSDVVFLGDSYTFGEGVGDSETLPDRFSAMTGLSAVNAGFSGYGPQHALRILELGRLQKAGVAPPKLFVYLAILDHIPRAAGRALWAVRGPAYEVVDGRAQYRGRAMDVWPSRAVAPAPSRIVRILNQSRIYRARFPVPRYSPANPADLEADRERFLAIVTTMAETAQREFGAPLMVILWDRSPLMTPQRLADADWIAGRLAQRKIPCLRLTETIHQADFERLIHAGETHPNARAYDLVAAALAGFVRETFPGLTAPR